MNPFGWEKSVIPLLANHTVAKWTPQNMRVKYSTKSLSNGIRVSSTRILTVAHVVAHQGARLESVFASIEGRLLPCRVGASDGDLLLLECALPELGGVPRGSAVRIRDFADLDLPTGAEAVHRYYDHRAKLFKACPVLWHESQQLQRAFEHGMSGSGIFLMDSSILVGVVEWTNGVVHGPLEIQSFLQTAGVF